MPDLIRHPVPTWIPAFAGMTILRYLIAGEIIYFSLQSSTEIPKQLQFIREGCGFPNQNKRRS